MTSLAHSCVCCICQLEAAGVNTALDAAIGKISADVALCIGALADLSKGAGLAITNGVTAVHTAVAPLKQLKPAVLVGA